MTLLADGLDTRARLDWEGEDMSPEELEDFYAAQAQMVLEQCQVVGPMRSGERGLYDHNRDTKPEDSDA